VKSAVQELVLSFFILQLVDTIDTAMSCTRQL